jgi:hypothetical protein
MSDFNSFNCWSDILVVLLSSLMLEYHKADIETSGVSLSLHIVISVSTSAIQNLI